MIVLGLRSTLVKSEYLFEACPNCGASGSIQMNVYQQYAHICWVPVFPRQKIGVSICKNCRQVLKSEQMPPSLKLGYENMKLNTKAPFWHFTGLGVIGLIAIGVFISDVQTREKVGKLVLAPKKGDLYEIKEKEDVYTLYKVQKVEGDSVYFFVNKYQTNQESGLSDLFLKEYEKNETYGFSKAELITMNKKKLIIDIERY